jgi:hypothetical protein
MADPGRGLSHKPVTVLLLGIQQGQQSASPEAAGSADSRFCRLPVWSLLRSNQEEDEVHNAPAP